MSSEAKVGAHGGLDLHLSFFVRHVVQVAVWIRCDVVDCWRDNVVVDALGGDNGFESSSGTECVAGDTLGGRHDEGSVLVGSVIIKDGLDGHGLEFVIVGRRRSVGIHVPNATLRAMAAANP